MGFSPVFSFSYLFTTDLGYHLPSNQRSNTVECSKEPEVYTSSYQVNLHTPPILRMTGMGEMSWEEMSLFSPHT